MATAVNPLAPSWLEAPRDPNRLDPALWPGTTERSTSGELVIGGVPASELATQFGTPLYIIAETDFRVRAAAFRDAFESAARAHGTSVKFYYAAKALLTADLVAWLGELGYGIDVASGGELAVALAGGADPSLLGVHGNNKSLTEIGRAVAAGAGSIVIDSEIEIERVASVATAQDRVQGVRLRVNSGVHAHTHEYLATAREDQKFGVPLSDVERLVARIRSHSHLEFLGLHSHIGSQIFSVAGFIEAAERLLDVHARLLQAGPVPELNLGGGFGVAYTAADEPDEIGKQARELVAAVAKRCAALGIPLPRLAFEPGRYLAGPSGITLYSVGTVKDVAVSSEEGEGVRRYVSVDGGMSDNLRAALYGADYSVALASRVSSAPLSLVRVVGKHCESGDIVVRDGLLASDLLPNDLLAVATTGAYCFSLASNYNYLGRPPLVSVANGEATLLVRGETESDLLARDEGVARRGGSSRS